MKIGRGYGRRHGIAAWFAAGIAALAVLAVAPAMAEARDRFRSIPLGGTDVPLSQFWDSGDPGPFEAFRVVVAGKGTHRTRGRAGFNITIPGQPVAAFLYIGGLDKPGPGPHFPGGDEDVRVIVNGVVIPGDFVPVEHDAGNVYLNRLPITAFVQQGINNVKVRRYNLNNPDGAAVVAVYREDVAPEQRRRVVIHDGLDLAWCQMTPEFGPDSELVLFPFDSEGSDRTGEVVIGVGSAQPRRGEETFVYTGSDTLFGIGNLLPDSDSDGLPDILDRGVPLTRRDKAPLGNDPANFVPDLEAVPGAVSLQEDKLGRHVSRGGYGVGPELDLFRASYAIPGGHDFAAFQFQTEDPENCDSLVVYFAANELPLPPINCVPDVTLTKEVEPAEAYPGDVVTYTFTVTHATPECPVPFTEDIVVTDPTLLPAPPHVVCTIDQVNPGESEVCTHKFTVPPCGDERTAPGFCEGAEGCGEGDDGFKSPEFCHLVNVAEVTASTPPWHGLTLTASDDACISILPFKRLGDLVWNDANRNGRWDWRTEAGMGGVPVNLLQLGNEIKTTSTNQSGYYWFTDLRHGDYQVEVEPPPGYLPPAQYLNVTIDRCALEYLDADFGLLATPD